MKTLLNFFLLTLALDLGALDPVPAPTNQVDYSAPPGASYGVLTLNLHTWQEKDARGKLNRIADFIGRYKLDAALFQECAQHQDGTPVEVPAAAFQTLEDPLFLDDPSYPGNAAWLVQKRLKDVYGLDYELLWTWAHIGFGTYQEGSAVLSRHRITARGEGVVSTDEELESPSRRKIIWADTDVPGFGPLRLVSVHLGWGGDQLDQINKLGKTLGAQTPRPTLVGGDFNMDPALPGYPVLRDTFHFRDDYMSALDRGVQALTMDSRRIDYLWTLPGFPLVPLKSRTVFRPTQTSIYAPVSDHAGLVVWYGPASPSAQ